MKAYEVIVTPEAESDLSEISSYIAHNLQAPKTARQYLSTLRKEIGGLSYIATAYSLVSSEPWKSRGLRKMNIKNFLVYYRVDEANHCVYILQVLYAKRDQFDALRNLESDN